MRKILVGQQPGGYNDFIRSEYQHIDDRVIKTRIVAPEPLWAGKAGSTGRRLAMLCNLEVEQYHKEFLRFNILPVSSGIPFRVTKYTKEMGRYLKTQFLPEDLVICLGLDVAECIGVELEEPFVMYPTDSGIFYGYIPHPSGLNRWYNERENWQKAQDFMTALAYYPNEYDPESAEEVE